MNYSEKIDELLEELSLRVGVVDVFSLKQRSDISEILTEMGDLQFKNIIMEILYEEDESDYSHLGAGIFVKKGDEDKENAQRFKKDGEGDNVSYRPISDDEVEKIKQKQGDAGKKTAANTPQNQQGGGEQPQEKPKGGAFKGKGGDEYRSNLPDDDVASNKFKPTYEKKEQRQIDSMKSKGKEYYKELSPENQKLFDTSMEKVEVLMSSNASEEQKQEAAEWLVDNMKFSTNANGKKAYFNKLGGYRKIISGPAGTKASEELVNRVKQYADVQEYNASGVKTVLSTASKPDLGKDNEALPKNDEGVKNLFQSHPTLSRIRTSLHGLYGVKDENGKVKMPSNKYSKEYLKQSFDNPAIDKTIEAAQKLVDAGQLDEKFVTALKEHKDRLSKVLSEHEVPSEGAKDAINDSYNELFSNLHNSDSDAAGAIIKQIAENNLYEQELANGEEVYLPSAGNFPGGDKILKTGTERVDLISCKYGKSGRTYGFPANAKAVTQLHPNEEKRGRSGQYIGEDGYTMMVKDELVVGSTKNESKQKTQKFIKDNLEEIGLGATFSNTEIKQISEITVEYQEFITDVKSQLDGVKPAALYWEKFNELITQKEDELSTKLGELVSDEQLSSIVGPNNLKNIKNKKGQIRPQNLLGAIEIANNISTSGGYGLSHNKQYFDENDKPKYVTEEGTTNVDDYSITFRDKRTKGRAGGGPQMSFSGDGTKQDDSEESEE